MDLPEISPTPELVDPEQYDVYCQDDGSYIGDYKAAEKSGPPLELSFLYKGHWLIYKLNRKEKEEDEPSDESPA